MKLIFFALTFVLSTSAVAKDTPESGQGARALPISFRELCRQVRDCVAEVVASDTEIPSEDPAENKPRQIQVTNFVMMPFELSKHNFEKQLETSEEPDAAEQVAEFAKFFFGEKKRIEKRYSELKFLSVPKAQVKMRELANRFATALERARGLRGQAASTEEKESLVRE